MEHIGSAVEARLATSAAIRKKSRELDYHKRERAICMYMGLTLLRQYHDMKVYILKRDIRRLMARKYGV